MKASTHTFDTKLPAFLANAPEALVSWLERHPDLTWFARAEDILEAATAGDPDQEYEVAYDVPGKGRYVEARVHRVRNGLSANYTEAYMRRRDPGCMVIGDDSPTDKERFQDRFGYPFADLRAETLTWLESQPLALFVFQAGRQGLGEGALVIAPANAGFFAYGLALLQGILDPSSLSPSFRIGSIIYVAPPFRHTHFGGKQVVVHNRKAGLHELFSYNLYPGPSAKKGVYGVLIGQGEREGWVTAHCATAEVTSPYDNVVTFMHEGASGGGKSEMLQYPHREPDGRICLGDHLQTGRRRFIRLPQACRLRPVTDDMALCHTRLQKTEGKLTLTDAEEAWFIRVNHIEQYGVDPQLEQLTIHPPSPLLFLNIDTTKKSTALIWEHIEDAPGTPCPNPRVIMPREIVPGVVEEAVTVDIRSFGVRTPPCSRENPTYGILGLFHVLPPALAWLWRLTAPRGHGNPSIVDTGGMTSEGVGSYWPFSTGKRSTQANLLLEQFQRCTRTSYTLTPNQHIGIWKVGFMPQWLMREYLTRRGSAQFRPGQVSPARCSLLGYELNQMVIEGEKVPERYLKVYQQQEVGIEGYDQGAEIFRTFFETQLQKYEASQLSQLGREIITCFRDGGSVMDYEGLIPSDMRPR
ncbi:MAG: DUF4914 family protein [Bacteroidetes bacterium]|nr:MAG: DUF4914 family protein [Bacteroidota bacterium]